MSRVIDFVNSLDLGACSARLMDEIGAQLKSVQLPVADFARMAGIKENRLNYLLGCKGISLLRSEVRALALATGTGLNRVFGLPDLGNRDDVINEYEEVASRPDSVDAVAFCGPAKDTTCDIETMRTVLYLCCIRMCLEKYPEQ